MKQFRYLICMVSIGLAIISTSAQDQLAPSEDPPGGLNKNEVPQFVVIGFDDNTEAGPMKWMIDFMKDKKNPKGVGNPLTYDGSPARTSFYMSPQYSFNNQALKDVIKSAYDAGHEIGNHTKTHPHNYKMSPEWTIEEILMTEAEWTPEINDCNDWLVSSGVSKKDITGFRNPFLETSASTFNTLNTLKFVYDCSLEEGFQPGSNGKNHVWPYTLDWGSPGNKILVEWGSKSAVPNIAGLWEVPNYAMTVPPDEVASKYGFDSGLRTRMNQTQDWFDVTGGKVTGFDYNLWGLTAEGAFALKANEVCAIMKYTLDLRYENNRAPFMTGAHTQFYEDSWSSVNATNATTAEMKEAMEDFIDYALTLDDVRVVTAIDIIEWCRNPIKLGTTPISDTHVSEKVAKQLRIGNITTRSVEVTIPGEGNYSLDVYTLAGEKVATIQKGLFTEGTTTIAWQGQHLSRQPYCVSLKGNGYSSVKRVIF